MCDDDDVVRERLPIMIATIKQCTSNRTKNDGQHEEADDAEIDRYLAARRIEVLECSALFRAQNDRKSAEGTTKKAEDH